MSQPPYAYYEQELLFVRKLAHEFAKRYPAAAGRLMLEADRSADPHIERLIEAFALLTSRVQHKLDDEFPELTDALIGILYPHYSAPIPSIALVQFEADLARLDNPRGYQIPRHSRLTTQPVADLALKFRTCYPVQLYPVTVTSARLMSKPLPASLGAPIGAAAALQIRLDCSLPGGFASLELDSLRFFLAGDMPIVTLLYELLFCNAMSVVFRRPDGEGKKAEFNDPTKILKPVGFERDDGLLDYPSQSFIGYRLLTEYFAFRAKFLFVDLQGWEAVRVAGIGKTIDIIIFLSRSNPNIERAVEADTFRLGCTPIINLFSQTAEPIQLSHARYEHRVVPAVQFPYGMEVLSVNEVIGVNTSTNKHTEYKPFYSFRHGVLREDQSTFWTQTRRPSSTPNDRGTEVFLTLVDMKNRFQAPAEQNLIVRATCSNRDLPSRLKHASGQIRFDLEDAAPILRIHCVRSPTDSFRPPTRRGLQWRIISHLSLNHLSLTDQTESRDALQEILRLYDFVDPENDRQAASVARDAIDGIVSLKSRRAVCRVATKEHVGMRRGVEIVLELEEQKYLGSGLFLFASVLERFFGLYVTINSFTQLTVKIRGSEGIFRKWPARAGDMPLV